MCNSNLLTMKIRNLFLVFLLTAAVVSCKKDDDDDKFSQLTPTEHKSNMEDNALEVFAKMDAVKDLSAIDIVIELVKLLDSYEAPAYYSSPLKSVASLKDGSSSAIKLVYTEEEEFRSFKNTFDEESGIYTFNKETNSWVKTEESTTELTFKFKSDAGEDVVASLTNFKTTTVNNPDIYNNQEDMLSSAKMTLAADGEVLINFDFSASYDAKGLPTSIKETLIIEDYKLSAEFVYNSSVISVEQSWKYKDENIFSYFFENKGQFTYENLDGGEIDPTQGGFLQSNVARITIGNYKIEGTANWKAFNDKMKDVSEDDFASEKEKYEFMAKALNESVNLKLRYNNNNEIIAASEFYAFEEENGYFYDDNEDDYYYWTVNMRMKFADDSSMDESYFDNSFSELIQDVSDFFAYFEEKLQ